MDKRYQVFVSSTYADLREERRKVTQALMELDCIPAGMELFPAADEDQFEFIKRVIDDCDYYLLIIGGRYGSLTREGVSYTEQEYEYAISRGLKVIALLHESPDDIPFSKSESTPELREKLSDFRERVSKDRLVRFWKTADELPGLVALSLSKAIKMSPAVGWIRADRIAPADLLVELNEVRKRNDELQRKLAELTPQGTGVVRDLAGLDETIALHGRCSTQHGGRRWEATLTWGEVYAVVAPYLMKFPTDSRVKDILEDAAFKKSGSVGTSPILDDQDFQTVTVQLRALGLIKTQYSKTVSGGTGFFWGATQAGEEAMVQLRAIRSAK